MNKIVWRLMLLVSALSLIIFIILYPSLPTYIPINYDLRGNITSWGPKSSYWVLQVVPLLTCIGMRMLPKIDPRSKSYAQHKKAYNIITVVIVLSLTALNWVMVLPILGLDLPVESGINLLIGLMMIGLGNYMPQLRSNFFMGIRTPWALSNETVWRKTHRAGGIVFCLGGAVMVLAAFTNGYLMLAALAILFGGVGFVFVYSYLVYRKLKQEEPDAEDSKPD